MLAVVCGASASARAHDMGVERQDSAQRACDPPVAAHSVVHCLGHCSFEKK